MKFMKLKFNPNETLASIAYTFACAGGISQGLSPDEANYAGNAAAGIVKGISVDLSSTIFDKVEDTVKQAISKTMAQETFKHIPYEFQMLLYENAFSKKAIYAYQTDELPAKLLEDAIQRTFAQSETYDMETLDIELLSTSLIKNMEQELQNDHELNSLFSLYANKEILQRLRKLTKNTSEFEEAIYNIKPISQHKQPNSLHFLNSQIEFYGRTNEFNWLNSFCDSDKPLLYAFIEGFAGVGKSKLLYHFIQQFNDKHNWYMCFLTSNVISSLNDFVSYECSKNIFLVIDYASKYAEKIGNWILKLAESKTTSHKIRIIMIERRMESQVNPLDFSNNTLWLQNFYGTLHQEQILKEVEYGTLSIIQLDKSALFSIMDDYSKNVLNTPPLSIDAKEMIYKYVSIDLHLEPQKQTPLFILLATDAYIKEGSIRNWSTDLLVDNYLKRMLEFWHDALCQKDQDLYDSLLEIVVFATAMGGIDLNDDSPKFVSRALNKLLEHPECQSLFKNTSGLKNEIILPLEPDYIGEFLFLKYIDKLFPAKKRKTFLNALYCKPVEFAVFFTRTCEDFADSKTFKKLFNTLPDLLAPFNETAIDFATYSFLIMVLAHKSTYYKKYETTELLGNILDKAFIQSSEYYNFICSQYYSLLSDLTFFEEYDGAVNLNVTDDMLSIARQATMKLRKIYTTTEHTDTNLLLCLALAIANTSIYDSHIEAKQCANELHKLYEKHGDIEPEIAVYYAMALNNVICKITKSEQLLYKIAESSLQKIAALYKKHVVDSNNYQNTTVCIVNAVSNKTLKTQVNQQIKLLQAELNIQQPKITIEYAKALNNIVGLYAQRTNPKANGHFTTLQKLYTLNEENSEIAIEYAKSIVIFIIVCTPEKADKLLHIIQNLCNEYENCDADVFFTLIIRYVKALSNRLLISIKYAEPKEKIEWIYNEVQSIRQNYSNIITIPDVYLCQMEAIYNNTL